MRCAGLLSRRPGFGFQGVAPVFLFLFFSGACATVNEPEVVNPDNPPAMSPSLDDASKHHLKRRVVIARFSNETTYAKSVLLGDKRSMIGSMTSDILAARLEESGQFVLFERSDSEAILAALDGGGLGDLELPANYLIIGSLSQFGRHTTGESGVFSRTKVQKAWARVNIRLVDVGTGQVIYAEEGAGEAEIEAGTTFGVGTKAGYDSTLDSKAISAAVSKLVSNIVENMAAQPWRSYIISRDGENLVMGGGRSQGIRIGDRFSLKRRGREVVNPQTGVTMELPGEEAGVLEVVSLFGTTPLNEGAICRLVSGELAGDDFSAYIVEEIKQ